MEWVEGLNSTIAYIEEHLTGDVDCGALARLAHCSAYHYQRMFAYMAGCPCRSISGGGGCPWRQWISSRGRGCWMWP